MKHIGILISGRGSNMLALASAIRDGRVDAKIALVISNVASAEGLEKASEFGIKTLVLDHRGRKREEHDRAMAEALHQREVELVCLAGYMRLLSSWFIREFDGRILNIHPSLLPAFPGLDAQQQALDYGVRYTGCTVHFVDEQLDHGPIVGQATVPVHPHDSIGTLSARILEEEHRLYAESVGLIVSGRYRLEGRRVICIESGSIESGSKPAA
ncbi:MAG: phosphoribosylglycinamide formyltransferase [Acidobacteriota bacterium]